MIQHLSTFAILPKLDASDWHHVEVPAGISEVAHKVSGGTPKGERRRHALVCAAADLLVEGGFDAVRHRSVASRADLPLASTTYYFESLDDLVACAVEVVGNRELDVMRSRIEDVSQRRRGGAATVDLIVDIFVGAAGDADGLIARYERCIASARHMQLRDVQRRLRSQSDQMLADLLCRSGRTVEDDRLRRLVALVDGAVVGALSDVSPDPRGTATAILIDVIDVLAPVC